MSVLGADIEVTIGEVASEPIEQEKPRNDFLYVDISSVDRESKSITHAKCVPLNEAPSRARQALQHGDVLVSMTRPNLNAVALVPEHLDGAVGSTGFHVLRSRWVKPELLYYLVQSQAFIDELCLAVQGALYPAVRPKDIQAFAFRLPSRVEQTRIVEKLEELLGDLDAGVAELKAAQKKLTQYRQSLLKAAVEGALTADWRVENPPRETGADLLARILQERRARWEAQQLARFEAQGKTPPKNWQAKYSEPVAPDTTELPALPPGWVWASAEQLCEFITKGTTPRKETASATRSIPFIRVTNLTEQGVLDFSDQVFVAEETHRGFLSRSVVYPDDVLMNIVGPPLGQVSLVPETFAEWNINQAIAIFRAVAGVLPEYICRYLLSPNAQSWLGARAKTTAGQTNLTLELCRQLPVPLPPTDEQHQLVESANQLLLSTRDAIRAIESANRQSTAQRQNLLKTAFSGQLVPQDPSDEPASALLARIRAERATQVAANNARGRRKKVSS